MTKKVKESPPKASTATITTNDEVIVQQILQGSYVHNMLSTLSFFHSMVLRVCLIFVANIIRPLVVTLNLMVKNANIMVLCALGCQSTPSFILLFL